MARLLLRSLSCAFLVACGGPMNMDTSKSDLDGDGIADADDRCMADPEDLDGFEDEDGCPEAGTRTEGSVISTEQGEAKGPADVKTKSRKMKRSKAKPLKRRQASAQTKPYRKGAWGAAIDLDERAFVVFGFGKAWIGTGASSGKLQKGDVYKASFSPEGRYVGMVTSNGFAVASTSKGKIVQRYAYAKGTEDSPETKLILMQAGGSLIFFDGCHVRRANSAKSSSEVIGGPLCGRPLASADGKSWFVHQQDGSQVQVYQLEGKGEPKLVLGGESDEGGLGQLLLSPNGRYLCYSRFADGASFTCRDTQKGEEFLLWQGPTDRRAAFTASGKLGFGAGKRGSQRDLILADLDTRKLHTLGSLGAKEKWLRPVGEGFVASGGKRLLIFDLDLGQQIVVPLDGGGEWEGFSAIPGRNREFIVGKERRSTRDLFRITLQ